MVFSPMCVFGYFLHKQKVAQGAGMQSPHGGVGAQPPQSAGEAQPHLGTRGSPRRFLRGFPAIRERAAQLSLAEFRAGRREINFNHFRRRRVRRRKYFSRSALRSAEGARSRAERLPSAARSAVRRLRGKLVSERSERDFPRKDTGKVRKDFPRILRTYSLPCSTRPGARGRARSA